MDPVFEGSPGGPAQEEEGERRHQQSLGIDERPRDPLPGARLDEQDVGVVHLRAVVASRRARAAWKPSCTI